MVGEMACNQRNWLNLHGGSVIVWTGSHSAVSWRSQRGLSLQQLQDGVYIRHQLRLQPEKAKRQKKKPNNNETEWHIITDERSWQHNADKSDPVMAENTLSCASLNTRWSLCSSVEEWRYAKGMETFCKSSKPKTLLVLGAIMSFVWEVWILHLFWKWHNHTILV